VNLLVVSNMAHYRRADGVIVGHGATSRELSELAQLFDHVRHVACLHDEPAPASALPYTAENLELVPVPPAGGSSLRAKLGILEQFPDYARVIARELRDADAIHVRCPANVSMVALALLAGRRTPQRRWIKYAGNWQPEGREPTFYMLQRRWLATRFARAEVSVNGAWPDQPTHVHTLQNPCLTSDELTAGETAARSKQLAAPIRLVFAGHLGAAKNPRVAIEALAALRAAGVDARLDLAGGGAELAELRDEVATRGLAIHVALHGPVARDRLNELYAAAHFVVLPSRTEGWPKVLAEGMAFGAVPIATAVGSIPSLLGQFGTGAVHPAPPAAGDVAALVRDYVREPARWAAESRAAVEAAREFSYAGYRRRIRELLRLS
jgi:glycosyltransferase involved in cell wall biosynthesis